ncbi:MAG: AI-2E family transporter [Armatimonadetes bacterium]|nr:AI-2E family transporter [Armatimonadota bacterium]
MSTKLWWQIASATVVGVTVGIGLAVALARSAPVLLMFAVGLAIAQLLDPLLLALQRRGWTRLQALWTVALVGLAVLGLTATLLIPPLAAQLRSAAMAWPSYNEKAVALVEKAASELLKHIQDPALEKQYLEFVQEQVSAAQQWLSDKLPSLVAWVSNQIVRSVGWLMIALLLGLIAFHFALVIHDFRAGIEGMLPAAAAPHFHAIAAQIAAMMGQYLRGLASTAAIVGIFSALALGLVSLLFGTRYWLLIGLASGLLYVIPWLGGAVADLLAAFFGYTTAAHHPGWAAFANLVAVVVVNQLGDYIIMPRIVGRRLGLHPLAILFGILCGYQIFGILGVIFATPCLVCVKIVLAHWLPVRGRAPGERAPREPLDIDLAASVKHAYELARTWRQKLEDGLWRKTEQTGVEHDGDCSTSSDEA